MAADIFAEFSAAFGDDVVSWAPQRYLEEPRGKYHAPEMVLLRPRDVETLSQIVKLCNSRKIGVVPYAGGTGLVSGQIDPTGASVIVSVERLNKLRAVYPNEHLLIAEAGMILNDIHTAAQEHGLMFPLSLASQGSCRIGGNLATNAGGVQVLRYGNARHLCLGIEAVMPDGQVYNGLQRLHKDNTGYDLRNLLIGSEGSLGIITAASLKLFPEPKETATACIVVKSPEHALSLFHDMSARFDGLVSAFELISGQGMQFLQEKLPQIRMPFENIPEWMVLVEIGAGADANLNERLVTSLEAALANGYADDGIIAQNTSQRDEFWQLRETIPEANRHIGAIASHDISLPLSHIPDFIAQTHEKLQKICVLRINCFGHLGDGNLHFNCFPPKGKTNKDMKDYQAEITRAVHDAVASFGGSISAEHGIGRAKIDELTRYADPTKLALMRQIKSAIDPNNIMNPGVIVC